MSHHPSRFAPRERVKITALGPFNGRIGWIKQYLGSQVVNLGDYSYSVSTYRVEVDKYELNFSSSEIIRA